nr:MAG TPA: hypothetical protein [Bacteriophage sp.]
MAKAVLISIRPKWVDKILNGEKTLEVRKTRPNMEMPFKVYIYCTAGNLSYKVNGGMVRNVSGGKIVVGEFTCDNIATYNYDYCPHPEIGMDYDCGDSWWEIDDEDLKSACLAEKEFRDYAFGREEMYGWHISNLKIYDTPKPLSAFKGLCKIETNCVTTTPKWNVMAGQLNARPRAGAMWRN